ncbi:unnamed protein product (macronuclear) [Paramecium tetraurelia]|uniref:t-SNARE coiled-coil homology domain-containing protein n=1 Tax=Paramecium tetraurelia TaxID=5888 RepID=A0CXB8_PARTE|nr:uncharacterized protein GSPATT00011067001 [Paramecium tetraurelia]CAK75435.1 unnamed protein product [Paramecium tetraurelia]|eukprot:XP_001442832.1 hypothetical protein (macronuclear) [Paramecium tetraurelia strain d4-2]
MILNHDQQLNQKDLETLNQKKKLASILIENVSQNVMINKKRAELSEKEYPKQVVQMKKLDQEKSGPIKEVEQYQDFLNKVDIKQNKTYEQLGCFRSLRQQEQLQKIQTQIKQKIQMEQKQIDMQKLIDITTKENRDNSQIEKNLQIIEEIQEDKDYLINEEIQKNEQSGVVDKVQMEANLGKLKYQSKKASQGRLLKKATSLMLFKKLQQ